MKAGSGCAGVWLRGRRVQRRRWRAEEEEEEEEEMGRAASM